MSLLLLCGILVGFISIVSAGGSMLTLPLLIFMGLPPIVANGTNRISIIIQNLFALIELRKNNLYNWKLGLLLSMPAVIGSIYGASLAIYISDKVLNDTMAILMIIIIALIIIKPQRYLKKLNLQFNKLHTVLLLTLFTGIGIYGGFIQAGVGFLIIIVLLLLYPKKSLVQMHSIKTFVITIYLLISTIIFIINGHIDWTFATVLSIGSAIGGNLGGRFASRVSEKSLEILLVIIVALFSIKLLVGN